MILPRNAFSLAIATLLVVAMITGCSPAAKKSKLTERAGSYFKAGEYDKAKIEYLNLLRLDPQNVAAYDRIGTIWSEQGAPLRAAPFLLKAKELDPNNVGSRIRLVRVFISLGEMGEARKEALTILAQSPANDEALLLLVETDRTKEDIEEAKRRAQAFPTHDSLNFKLTEATLALQQGDHAASEAAARQALALAPQSPLAHLAMATCYMLRKDSIATGEEFKIAADLSPVRSEARLKYAQFKAQTGAVEEAKSLLNDITRQAPDYLAAWRALAQFALAEKNYPESLKLLDNIITRDPENIEAHILQAQTWLAAGQTKKSIEDLDHLSKTYPKVPVIKYQLARAYLQNNDPSKAAESLFQALAANPDYLEANLLLAQVNLQKANPSAVIIAMSDLLKKQPKSETANLLLAEAYQAAGRLDDAVALLRNEIAASPEKTQFYLLLGLVLRQQDKPEDARRVFEQALALAPSSFAAVDQLTEIDISGKNFGPAMERAEETIQRNPTSAGAHFIKAKIYAAQHDWDHAEATLLKTLELDPNLLQAYNLLISAYVSAGKLPQAIGQMEALLQKEPNNPRALMMSALICERMKDFSKAARSYEKLLATKPNFMPALNNLSYLYAEHLNQLDKAYELARKARELQPTDASVADTLGWIAYKRGDYSQALALLRESAEKLSDNPEVQFHLGMAYYMMGQTDAARQSLQRVANSPAEFPGKEESKRRLKLLEGTDAAKDMSIDELKTLLVQQPNDLVARMRLAEAYQSRGMFVEASAACTEALKLSPKFLPGLIKLAQLNAGPLKDPDKAMAIAKEAREIAPADPKVAAVLGSVAFQIGNFAWAYSLLRDSVRTLAADPAVLHDYACAAYSLGNVSEAQRSMQNLLRIAPDSKEAEEAKSFLAMIALDSSPENLISSEPQVQKLLKLKPNYVPALMVQGALQENRGEAAAAGNTYSEVLRRFPDFAPAQKRLASLYAVDPNKLEKAYELATKARRILPDDPELARTLAEISYQKKDFPRVITLLEQSGRRKPLDARSFFFLGMSKLEAQQNSEGVRALNEALTAGLSEPFATEARKSIADLGKK